MLNKTSVKFLLGFLLVLIVSVIFAKLIMFYDYKTSPTPQFINTKN